MRQTEGETFEEREDREFVVCGLKLVRHDLSADYTDYADSEILNPQKLSECHFQIPQLILTSNLCNLRNLWINFLFRILLNRKISRFRMMDDNRRRGLLGIELKLFRQFNIDA